MADEEKTPLPEDNPTPPADEETTKAPVGQTSLDPDYEEFLIWKRNRAEITARYGLQAHKPGNTARRLVLNRAYRGARTGEEPIHAGAYFEDDPQLKGLAEFLVEGQFAEWLD